MDERHQPYLIVFQLDAPTPDYERVYAAVHAAGGYHYLPAASPTSGWQSLPHGSVVLPMAASSPECARVAFELLLARLGLSPLSTLVIAGEPNGRLQTIPVNASPNFLGTGGPRHPSEALPAAS